METTARTTITSTDMASSSQGLASCSTFLLLRLALAEPLDERSILGKQKAFATVDVSAGLERDAWSMEFSILNAFDERGDLQRFSQCTAGVCGGTTYIVPTRPRTFSLRLGRSF